jgi:anti-sigma B factor antagonist
MLHVFGLNPSPCNRGHDNVIEEIREVDGATVVRISGRLDASTASDVKTTLHELIEEGNSRLILSLSDLEFIDSSGLGILVGCLRRCSSRGGDLYLAEVPEIVRSVLELTRLTRVFRLAEDEQTAVDLITEECT